MKGFVWESIAFVLTTIAVYLVYGNILSSIKFGLVLTIVKMILFFAHERIWKRIRWGKYHIIKGKKVWDKRAII